MGKVRERTGNYEEEIRWVSMAGGREAYLDVKDGGVFMIK